MKRIIDFLDSLDFSPMTMVLTIFGLATIRLFLENFSSPEASGLFAPVVGIISYASLYGMLILAISFALSFFSKKDLLWSLRVVILFFPIILLTPIIDLIVSNGSGFCIGYAQTAGQSFSNLFFNFLLPHTQACGITPGLRFQIISIILGLFGLVLGVTRSWIRSFGIGTAAYILAFIGGHFPNIISRTFTTDATSSLLTTTHYPTDTLFFTPLISTITTTLLGRVQIIFFFMLLAVTWFIVSRKTWIGYWRGFLAKLPIAFIHVTLMIFGMWVGVQTQQVSLVWPDWTGIFLATLSLLFACSFLGIENDIQDFEIDKISNRSWWLIDQKMSIPELRTIQKLSLIFSITTAILINHNLFFGILVFISLYSIYSGGLRLKRFWLTSSFLISLSGITAFISGYFTLSSNQLAQSIPLSVILMLGTILIPYTLIKDIPDIAGDASQNIKTFAVLYGKNKAIILSLTFIALWFGFFISIIPWFFGIGVIIPILFFLIQPHLIDKKLWLLGLPVGIWFIGVLIHILII